MFKDKLLIYHFQLKDSPQWIPFLDQLHYWPRSIRRWSTIIHELYIIKIEECTIHRARPFFFYKHESNTTEKYTKFPEAITENYGLQN